MSYIRDNLNKLFIDSFLIQKYINLSLQDLSKLHDFQKVFLYYLFIEFPEFDVLKKVEKYNQKLEQIKNSMKEDNIQITKMKEMLEKIGTPEKIVKEEVEKIRKNIYKGKIIQLNKEFGIENGTKI